VTDTKPNRMPMPPYHPPEDAPVLTDRDRDYAALYLQILDGSAAGASWQTLARDVLKLDPVSGPELAKTVFDQFEARALWLTQVGYKLLAKSPR